MTSCMFYLSTQSTPTLWCQTVVVDYLRKSLQYCMREVDQIYTVERQNVPKLLTQSVQCRTTMARSVTCVVIQFFNSTELLTNAGKHVTANDACAHSQRWQFSDFWLAPVMCAIWCYVISSLFSDQMSSDGPTNGLSICLLKRVVDMLIPL